MKKIININGRFLSQSITGVQRYAIELVKAIDDLLGNKESCVEEYSFILLIPKNAKNTIKLKNIEIREIGIFSGQLWEQLELSLYSFNRILLNFCNTAPILKFKKIVTIHDAAVYSHPEGYSKIFRSWYKILLPILGRTSLKIVTDSDFSKSEIMKYGICSARKIEVIFLASFKSENEKSGFDFSRYKRRYIFAVSSMNPNKNFKNLVEAIKVINDNSFDVLVAGGINNKIFDNSSETLSSFVHQIGYVTDGQLEVLYQNASCFVFPSIYEGFGLPPLEAMSHGCPVICSTAASLPEVCGDAALYCDPYDPQDIAHKIIKMMNSDDMRRTYREKGLARAAEFSWRQSAIHLVSLLAKEKY